MAPSFLKLSVSCVLIIIFAGAPQAVSRMAHHASMMERHEQWMATYGRDYKDSAEKEKRYNIFKANVEYIELVNNARNKPYKLGVNEFADLTNAEFKAAHNKYSTFPKTSTSSTIHFRHANVTSIPPSVDWSQKGAVTPIRDAVCGAWAIPAVDTVEGLIKIETGKLYTLSVQEIVDCDDGGHGCDGGFIEEAFEFIKQHGLTTESNYPSNATAGICNTNKEKEPVAKIGGYENVPADDEMALLQAVANQPVAVTVDASSEDFQFYSGGVFTGKCGTVQDHGVTLVGYGTSNGQLKYWRIKNSWGTSWGEDGYMRLQRDIAAKEGLCGIAMEGIFPTV